MSIKVTFYRQYRHGEAEREYAAGVIVVDGDQVTANGVGGNWLARFPGVQEGDVDAVMDLLNYLTALKDERYRIEIEEDYTEHVVPEVVTDELHKEAEEGEA